MAQRGRPIGPPKRHLNREGNPTGNYYSYHPVLKRQVSTGTADEAKAREIQRQWLADAGHIPNHPIPNTRLVAPTPVVNPVNTDNNEVINLDNVGGNDAGDILSKWASTKLGDVAPSQSSEGNQSTITTENIAIETTAPADPSRVKSSKGLSPEQVARIAIGLKKIATNMNIIVDAYVVKSMGKNPAQIGDDEIELMQLGWELTLDEYLTKKKPKPIHVLMAANAMVISAMYLHGEPIKKQPQNKPPGHSPDPPQPNNVIEIPKVPK